MHACKHEGIKPNISTLPNSIKAYGIRWYLSAHKNSMLQIVSFLWWAYNVLLRVYANINVASMRLCMHVCTNEYKWEKVCLYSCIYMSKFRTSAIEKSELKIVQERGCHC